MGHANGQARQRVNIRRPIAILIIIRKQGTGGACAVVVSIGCAPEITEAPGEDVSIHTDGFTGAKTVGITGRRGG